MTECRKKFKQYSVDYLKYGFIESASDKRLPMFLVCNKVLSNDAMKPSKLEDHLKRCHPNIRSKDSKYFQILKEKLQKRPSLDRMFALISQRDDNGGRDATRDDQRILEDVPTAPISFRPVIPKVVYIDPQRSMTTCKGSTSAEK
ncbi:SCAN domain-containing protein 3 [Trichonephila clavipes]|nr:SCAN domain-containing protein 3 [Trichonephila clavipes]